MPGRTAPLSLYERDPARDVPVSHGACWFTDVEMASVCLPQLDMFGSGGGGGPHYMVTIPAVLEAGAESRFCLSLLRPNETLQMTVTLMSEEENITLFQQTSDEGFHNCILFKVVSSFLT
ncbi:Ovostatin [Merluccius polli]|uniref:Ovostatin n=1 Tax=Merluccius polli TaxID=89951 RepID=A0AA47P6H6_MERPO|nr:Ovostatin [Merluccius polli]